MILTVAKPDIKPGSCVYSVGVSPIAPPIIEVYRCYKTRTTTVRFHMVDGCYDAAYTPNADGMVIDDVLDPPELAMTTLLHFIEHMQNTQI